MAAFDPVGAEERRIQVTVSDRKETVSVMWASWLSLSSLSLFWPGDWGSVFPLRSQDNGVDWEMVGGVKLGVYIERINGAPGLQGLSLLTWT